MRNPDNQPLTILTGDCRELLKTLPAESVHCCITSPPYWRLRDYGHPDQISQEATPEEYVETLRVVFAEVRRVLRSDGTLWLNLGDSYASAWPCQRRNRMGNGSLPNSRREARPPRLGPGLKDKDLVGIPWLVALALWQDGWYLRSDIIWHKPNAIPESATDRPTRAHEYLFLLSKSKRYHYDAAAIREPPSLTFLNEIESGYNRGSTKDFAGGLAQDASTTKRRIIEGYRKRIDKQRGHSRCDADLERRWDRLSEAEQRLCGCNKRSVWTVATAGYRGAHFATYPPALIKPCVLAGCPPGGVVLDPFAGSGTTGAVALELGRRVVLMELNPEYVELIRERCTTTSPLAFAA